MTGDRETHPNLSSALEPHDDVDGAELDAIARRLADASAEPLTSPPPDLFARIQAELDADADADAGVASSAPSPTEAPAPVVELAARRRRVPTWVALSSVAAVLLLVVGLAAVLRGGDDEPVRQEIELAALEGFETAEGSAVLEVDGDDRSVRVDLADVDVPDGSHLELWLLDPEVEQLVALGEITGDGPHQLEDDVDLDATPIVDVSLEPDDGDPSHSGVSVLRGELDPA